MVNLLEVLPRVETVRGLNLLKEGREVVVVVVESLVRLLNLDLERTEAVFCRTNLRLLLALLMLLLDEGLL